jgi:hypothetical protein
MSFDPHRSATGESSQRDLFDWPSVQPSRESRVVHDLAVTHVNSVMQIPSAGCDEVRAQGRLLTLQRQPFKFSHCELPLVVLLPEGDAAVSGLRRGFRALAGGFQMKQEFCVSSEIRRGWRRNTLLTDPAQDPRRPTLIKDAEEEIPMKAYRLITLVAAVLINVLVARVLIVDDEIGVSPDQAPAAAAQAP